MSRIPTKHPRRHSRYAYDHVKDARKCRSPDEEKATWMDVAAAYDAGLMRGRQIVKRKAL